MRRPFPLYNDGDIFKCTSKEIQDALNKNLIAHDKDDDYDTPIETVDDHVEMCLAELKEDIERYVATDDPLKLCRNARGEFSGIQRIECKQHDDECESESTPDSSWYEIISVPTIQESSEFNNSS